MNTANHHISVAEIIALAAAQGQCTPADITGKRRFRHIVRVRHRAMAVARMVRQDKSLVLLGRIFGGRDHSTIIHGVRRQYARVHQDPDEAVATEILWCAAMTRSVTAQIEAHERAIAALRQQEAALQRAAERTAGLVQ